MSNKSMVTGWLDINGVSLRYARRGVGGRTAVLLHEMGGSLESWNRVIDALPSDVSLLSYDMRGMGLSEKVSGPVAMAQMVEDLSHLLDALAITEKVALVGCAVGAAVALSFTLQHPERISKVMAMSPATGVAPERRERADRYIARLEAGDLRRLVDEGMDRTFPSQFRTDPEAFHAARGRLLANDARSYAAIYRMLTRLDLDDQISAIACPVTFVAGTLDTARPPESVAALARRVVDGRLLVLETGHAMAVLTPALVAEAITGFLAS